MTPSTTPVVVLGTADWDQPIATNQHYATREISRRWPTVFIESLGLRRPELTKRDIARMARRVRARTPHSPRERPEALHVVTPKAIPVHTGVAARVNAHLLSRQFVFWRPGSVIPVLWTYSPITYRLHERATTTIYHCVDLLGRVPRIDQAAIENGERELARAGAVAVASSDVVADHLHGVGFARVHRWPNVADVAPFESARSPHRRPAAVFAGNLTATKIDFALLRRLVDDGVELHLAGPVAEGGGDDAALVDGLVRAGARHHGMLDPAGLAALMNECTVGLIPYLRNDYTRGVSPLKTYEYLAAGLVVVGTDLPGLPDEPHSVVRTPDDDTFLGHVRTHLDAGVPDASLVEARTVLARAHSWTGRGAQIRELVGQALASAPTGAAE